MIETNEIESEPVSGNPVSRIDELEAECCCHKIETNKIEPEPVSGTNLPRMDELEADSHPPSRNQQHRT